MGVWCCGVPYPQSLLHVTRIKTAFGRRAFSSAAPQIWNHIPTAWIDYACGAYGMLYVRKLCSYCY